MFKAGSGAFDSLSRNPRDRDDKYARILGPLESLFAQRRGLGVNTGMYVHMRNECCSNYFLRNLG